jgi:flavin-dependent dehydrogenase
VTTALVVGAGPAGAAAAIRLAGWCDSVTMIEARPRHWPGRAGEHLPPAALTALTRRGFSELLVHDAHERSPGVRSAWGAGFPADKNYFMTTPSMGLNLRRQHVDEALARRAERAGARVLFDTRLHQLIRAHNGYVATVRDPNGDRAIRADVVVDASGRSAIAARRLGAIRRRHDELVAIVGRLEGCEPNEDVGRVHVESVEHGWWYGVLFSDGTLLATLMTDASIVQLHSERAPGLWTEQLRNNRLIAPLANGGRWSGHVDVFDAAAQVLEHDAPRGFLAVGDAAAAYDPLSSSGITKGFCDGFAGADALAQSWAGDPNAVIEHRNTQQRDFEAHRVRQNDFYRAETRWPASPFWRSRHEGLLRRAS